MPAKTMLGMQSPLAGAVAPPTSAAPGTPVAAPGTPVTAPAKPATPGPVGAPAGKATPAKTMLGMMAPPGLQGPPGGGPNPPAAAGSASGDIGSQKTVLGMQSPLGTGAAPVGAPAVDTPPARTAPATDPSDLATKGTVLGMQSPLSAGADRADGAARTDPAPPMPSASPTPAAAAKPQIAAASNRTVLGVASPLLSSPAPSGASGAPDPVTDPAVDPVAAAPEPGAEEGTPAQARLSFTEPMAAPDVSASTAEIAAQVVPGAASSRKSGTGMLVVAGVLAVVAVVAAAMALLGGGPEIRTRVVVSGAGDALEVEVPEAPSGTKIRFAGQEAELKAGVANLPLATDALKLGENVLGIDVISPDGSVSRQDVALRVDYRVRADLSSLEKDPPGVDVVVDAQPGSKVTLSTQDLALDAQGHAMKTYPVSDTNGGTFGLEVPYVVETPDGVTHRSKLNLVLPVTGLHIDRPGAEAVTEANSIEVAGAVEPGAKLTINGAAVQVVDKRFVHRVPLPKPGGYTINVTARAKDKAPHNVPLVVRRVQDMALAAASFQADKSLTYARIAQNPTIYRGQKVGFDGRVYNVLVENGRSVLQLLVRDCPRAQRCPLWVELPQATDVTTNNWVRVLGTVAGSKEFDSNRGETQSVPSVAAQYVLPLAR